MRLPVLFAVAGLTLGVAACATVETPPVLKDASAPQPLERYDWIYFADGDEASLAYGVDETDDVWLDLSCRRGSGQVMLGRSVSDAEPHVIALESGGDTERYQARFEPAHPEHDDGGYLISEAAASDPVFLRFRSTGWLALYGDDYRTPMVAHPGSEARIERFFAFCG